MGTQYPERANLERSCLLKNMIKAFLLIIAALASTAHTLKGYEVISGPTKEICNERQTSKTVQSCIYDSTTCIDSSFFKCKEKCDNDQNCNFFSFTRYARHYMSHHDGIVCKTYSKCATLKTAVMIQTIYKKLVPRCKCDDRGIQINNDNGNWCWLEKSP